MASNKYMRYRGKKVHSVLWSDEAHGGRFQQALLEDMTDGMAIGYAHEVARQNPIVSVAQVSVPENYPVSPLEYNHLWATR